MWVPQLAQPEPSSGHYFTDRDTVEYFIGGMTNYSIGPHQTQSNGTGPHLTLCEQLCSTKDIISSKAKQRKGHECTVYPKCVKLQLLATESELKSLNVNLYNNNTRIYYIYT